MLSSRNHKSHSKNIGVSYRRSTSLTSIPFSGILESTNWPNHENYKITSDQFKDVTHSQNDFELLIKRKFNY